MIGRQGMTTLVAVVALTLTAAAQQAKRPEVLLQEAINKETLAGDIDGAIAALRSLVDASEPDIAARALVHLGALYEKSGRAGARAMYERAAQQYPKAAAAAEARAWLAANPPPAPGRVAARADEVVWSGPGANFEARPMPDGRSVVHWDLSSGNLAIRDLSTGATRLLTRDAGPHRGFEFYENPVPSPSGTRIAVRFGGEIVESTIRLVSVDGQRNDVLARLGHEYSLVDWSPDEKYLAAERWPGDGSVGFVLISTADGSVRQLLTLPRGGSLGGFSRDGRYLVYSRSADDDTPTGGIYLIATDAGAVVPIFESPHAFRNPSWTPDGRHVFFGSNLSGAPGLWSTEVVNARRVGEPVLREAGFNPQRFMGFTRDGSFFYAREEAQSDAFLVDFDPATLRATNPTRVTEFFVGRNSEPEVSPDGRHVAFVRRPGTGPTVVLRSLDSKEERTLMTFQGAYGAHTLQWFPDGKALLLTDRVERRTKRFRKIDIQTGQSTTLFEGPWDVWTGALSPDGTTLYYSVKDSAGVGNVLMKRNLDSGTEVEIYRTPAVGAEGIGLFGLSVSPAGDRVAFTRNVESGDRLLMVVSADGSDRREILTSPRLFFPGALGWTPDGRHLIVTLSVPFAPPEELGAIAVDTGEMKALGLQMPLGGVHDRISSQIVSVDGRRIAITGSSTRNEIRALRNILGPSAAAR